MDVCFRGVFKLLESVLLFTPYRKLCPGYTGEIMEKNGFFNYHESLPFFFFLLFLAISAAPLEKKKEKKKKQKSRCNAAHSATLYGSFRRFNIHSCYHYCYLQEKSRQTSISFFRFQSFDHKSYDSSWF